MSLTIELVYRLNNPVGSRLTVMSSHGVLCVTKAVVNTARFKYAVTHVKSAALVCSFASLAKATLAAQLWSKFDWEPWNDYTEETCSATSAQLIAIVQRMDATGLWNRGLVPNVKKEY